MKAKASFHISRFRFVHPFKIVIRNIHNFTLGDDISTALSEEGPIVGQVHNLKNK